MWRYLLAWFPMLLIAIANGAIRDIGYRGRVGELRAHQISTVIGCIVFCIYIRAVVHTWPPASPEMALGIGLLWLILTLAFEFGFGRARRVPWETLLHDYNLLAGRLWLFIPLVVALAPLLFYYL